MGKILSIRGENPVSAHGAALPEGAVEDSCLLSPFRPHSPPRAHTHAAFAADVVISVPVSAAHATLASGAIVSGSSTPVSVYRFGDAPTWTISQPETNVVNKL